MKTLYSALFILAIISSNAFAVTYPVGPNTEVVGKVMTITPKLNDTFSYYARHYSVAPYALMLANPGINEDYPDQQPRDIIIPGEFVLPSKRQGIVINLPELRLYYFNGSQVNTYPVTTGRVGWKTPEGNTSVTWKERNPTWDVPASIMAEARRNGQTLPARVPPGPNNPLGQYALHLGISGYLIHGTNNSTSIGRRVSHGCIRMFPADIEALFNQVPEGVSVAIVNEPIKAGWRNDQLYLQVFPLLHERQVGESARQDLAQDVIRRASGGVDVDIDWDAVQRLMYEESGIPGVIGRY